MKLAKLRYVLSKEFIKLCADNIATMGMSRVILIAERHYTFANPKGDDLIIDESDVKRAVSIANHEDARYDRIANLYAWINHNLSHFVATKNISRDVLKSIWMSYRDYIALNRLEELWVITKVYEEGCAVEQEFGHVCEMIANDTL